MNQTPEEWQKELQHALKIADNHISLYELMVKTGTLLYNAYRQGKYILPKPEKVANMYETAIKLSCKHGFVQYEVSNFMRNNKYSHHNSGYWAGLDYLGIGPGAHGRITDPVSGARKRTYNILSPNEWMSQCKDSGHGLRKSVVLSLQEVKDELVVFGLRSKMGVSCEQFGRLSGGQELEEHLNVEQLQYCIANQLLEWQKNEFINVPKGSTMEFKLENKGEKINGGSKQKKNRRLCPTERGLCVIDEIIPRILSK
ncbi:11023_t:CDS:2 [Paraglomus occultum]|uniref:11023_t:CDS:1 n=1 Tax=Paraglomus occultum TaxID=144539 RepID=A0A9N9GAK3_9GLOM|nr:11023_t:CDS:2 [Paraglomus occultum]